MNLMRAPLPSSRRTPETAWVHLLLTSHQIVVSTLVGHVAQMYVALQIIIPSLLHLQFTLHSQLLQISCKCLTAILILLLTTKVVIEIALKVRS